MAFLFFHGILCDTLIRTTTLSLRLKEAIDSACLTSLGILFHKFAILLK